MYENDVRNVSYVWSQMEAPVFEAMHTWIVDMGRSFTIGALFNEIEHYMEIYLKSRDAKKGLATITTRNSESASELYYRVFKPWQKAKAPWKRIETFLVAFFQGPIAVSLPQLLPIPKTAMNRQFGV